MLHPIREFKEDPISAGWLYGSLTEGGAVSSFLLRMGPFAQILLVAILVIAGLGVMAGGIWKFNHPKGDAREASA